MYDYEGGKDSDLYIVDENGHLAKSIRRQVEVGSESIHKLNSKLEDKRAYGGTTASCFNPHVGFVYYLKGKSVAHISICLDCNRLRSSIEIPAQKQGKIGKGSEAYYIADGLSKSFRRFINGLLSAAQFSHQIKSGSHFDE